MTTKGNMMEPTQNGLDRRGFLGRAGALAGGLVIAPTLLAACGSDDKKKTDSSGGANSSGGGKSIAVSNWTSYMDTALLKLFTKETGIKIKYVEDVNDNIEYFNAVKPNLQRKQSIKRDGFVLTDWMANRMINQAQWTQPFAKDKFPNMKNLREALKSPSFDPTRASSAPWASGVAGIAYNIDLTDGKEIKTLDEFLSTTGTKTVLSEMRDTVGIFMLADGKDITKPSFADAAGAFDALDAAVSDGKIDGFNGNDYVTELGNGNLTACFAWSGDVAQLTLDNPRIHFAAPESGATLWSDNFMIPNTTDQPDLATEFINFFYDPVIAAKLAAFIQYISPVEQVADELTKLGGDAAALVDNPLVVPTPEFLDTLSIFGALERAEEKKFEDRFAQILGNG